jgi:hypothetical protein
VEVFNGTCYALSDPLVMTGGLAQLEELNESFEFAPNPVQNVMVLKGELAAKAVNFTIKDMNGKEISTVVSNGTNYQMISVDHISNGTYLVDLIGQHGEVIYRKRFVIAR